MKRIFLFSLLLCLGMGSVSAQTENKSKSDQRKLLEAQEGAQKFQMAKIALNSRNFVWEFYDPRSTDKSKVCYNFMHGLHRECVVKDSDKVWVKSIPLQ